MQQWMGLGLITAYSKNIWWGRFIGPSSEWVNGIRKQLGASKKQASLMEALCLDQRD